MTQLKQRLSSASCCVSACRSLKKVDNLSLARLRVDIKDFQPAGVPGLEDGVAPWVCIGKHLCGAASDFTLQCCASSLHAGSSFSQPEHQTSTCQPAQTSSGDASAAGPRNHADKLRYSRGSDCTTQSVPSVTSADAMHQQSRGRDKAGVSRQPAAALNQGSQPATSDTAQADSLETDEDISGHKADCSGTSRQGIQGLAIATCCHHRCSWQHYVGKPTFQQLGFSPEDFEVMSWMTGLCFVNLYVLQCEYTWEEADCHSQLATRHSACQYIWLPLHRIFSQQDCFARFSFCSGPLVQPCISLILSCHADLFGSAHGVCTAGWALCGHETPNLEDVSNGHNETACNSSEARHCCDDNAAVMPSDIAQQLGQAQSAKDHEKPTAHLADDDVINLARSERMQLGQKCKRLIDFGRQQWMAAQGFQVLHF